MRNLFFFGTLRHPPLLEVVLGRKAKALDITEAALPEHLVSAVSNETFPTIAVQDGACAAGILVSGLDETDVARLDFYEGAFAYDLSPVILADGRAAEVYLPQPGLWQTDGAWSLEKWVETHGALSVTAAREVMSYFGTKSRVEVAAMFAMIRSRAASTMRAAHSRHGSDGFRGRVEVQKQARAYAKFFALDDIELRHERFDGSMSDVLDRAVFVSSDAALVLPYDPVRDCVMVVEQFRPSSVVRGDTTCWQIEPIAGRVDAGETPQDAARREAREEAGLDIAALELIAETYPSPGTSTEFYYLYLGLADLPSDAAGTGGLMDENEDIRSHIWSFDELMARVACFDVANMPLVTSAYYLSHHRDRLRSVGAGATPKGS